MKNDFVCYGLLKENSSSIHSAFFFLKVIKFPHGNVSTWKTSEADFGKNCV